LAVLRDREEEPSRQRVREALIPIFVEWMGGGRGCLTFRATQLVTGHGSFGDYLVRIGRVGSPVCPHCGGAVDSARHTLEECPAWAAERGVSVARIGPDFHLTAVLGAAASAPSKWSAFLSFAEAVMTAKEVVERGRQAEAADALALRLGLARVCTPRHL